MNTNLHPIFANLWFFPKSPEAEEALKAEERNRKLAAYHDLLSGFDWQFNHADEHARWKQGKAAHERLVKLQMDIDPDASIWMSYPGANKHGAAQPVLRGGQR